MIVQYTDSYSSPSADIQNLIANKISLLDSYILMQTGQYEYTALVYNNVSKQGTRYVISRNTATGYNNQYSVRSFEDDSFEYTCANEYYVYSNDGVGKSLDLPVIEAVTAYALVVLCCLALFAVVFKGALFRCLRRR